MRLPAKLVFPALGGLLFAAVFLGVLIGNVAVDPGQTLLALLQAVPGLAGLGGEVDPVVRTIAVDLRLPRVLLALFVGGALGVAGAAMQGLLRNPLADPYLFGVSSGAAVGTAAATFAGFALFGALSLPAASFVGAVGATFLVYEVARVGRQLPPEGMLLAGIAIGSLLAAVASFIIYLDAARRVNVLFWLLGSFHTAAWPQVAIVAPLTLVGAAFVMLRARQLNALLLGDDMADHLGVDSNRTRAELLFLVALLTAGAVAFAGIIGFVGVIVPHTMRLIIGPDHRLLVPASGAFGGLLLIACDLVARSSVRGAEVPVGILTAFLGAPFFIYLLRRAGRLRSWG